MLLPAYLSRGDILGDQDRLRRDAYYLGAAVATGIDTGCRRECRRAGAALLFVLAAPAASAQAPLHSQYPPDMHSPAFERAEQIDAVPA